MKKLSSIGFCIFAFLSLSCIKMPSPPSWDTEINIPLADTTIYFSDIAEEIDNLREDSTGSYPEIYLEEPLDTLQLGEDLSLGDIDYSFSYSVGSFEFPDVTSPPLTVVLSEILPDSLFPASGEIVVPPIDPVLITKFSSLPDVEWIFITSGTAILTVKNYFPIDIYPLEITVFNDYGENITSFFSGDTVKSNETSSDTSYLSNVFVTGNLKLEINIGSPGSYGQLVTISPDDSLSIVLELKDLIVDSARGNIEDINVTDTTSVPLTSEWVSVDSVGFKSGTASIDVNNNTPLSAVVQILIPSLDFDTTLSLTGGGSQSITLTLSNRRFTPPDNTPDVDIYSIVNLQGGYVTLSSQDRFDLGFHIQDVELSFFAGILSTPLVFSLISWDTSFTLPGGVENIKFAKVEVWGRVWNTSISNAYAQFYFKINEEQEIYSIDIISGISDFFFDVTDQFNSSITGDSLSFSSIGELTLSGPVFLRREDILTGEIKLTVPLRFILYPDTIYMDTIRDTTEVDIPDTEFGEGTWHIEVTNHLPFGGSFSLRVTAEDETGTMDTLSQFVEIPTPPINPITGTVAKDTTSIVEIKLTETDVDFFTRTPRDVWIEIYLPGTAPDTVLVSLSDYMKVKSIVALAIRVDPEGW